MQAKVVVKRLEDQEVLEVQHAPSVRTLLHYALARGVDVGFPVASGGEYTFELLGDRLAHVVQGDAEFMRQLADLTALLVFRLEDCMPESVRKRARKAFATEDVAQAVWNAFRALLDAGFHARKWCPEKVVEILKEG